MSDREYFDIVHLGLHELKDVLLFISGLFVKFFEELEEKLKLISDIRVTINESNLITLHVSPGIVTKLAIKLGKLFI